MAMVHVYINSDIKLLFISMCTFYDSGMYQPTLTTSNLGKINRVVGHESYRPQISLPAPRNVNELFILYLYIAKCICT